MRFPVPKTVTGAASPLILMNWIFGIGVIQYPMGKPRLIISTLWSIANFLAYLSFVIMADFSGLIEIDTFKIAANNYRVVAYFFVVFIAVSICLAHARAKVIRRTFTELNDMNGRLKRLGILNDYEAVWKAQIIHLCIAFSAICTMMVVDFIYVRFDFPSETSRLGFFMTYHYFLASVFIIDYTFGASIRYFGNRFRCLNALIIELDSSEISKTTVTHDQSDGDQFPHYSSLILEIHGNNFPSIRTAKNQWLFFVIRETRKMHRGLCKTATELNGAFGMQVLLSVTLSFGLMITVLYTTYIIVVNLSSNGSLSEIWPNIVVTLMWIMFHATKVLLMVHSCETTSYEASRTGGLVSDLLQTTPCDDINRDEINIFMLQLVQNRLSFTAVGLFSLNYSLIYGMIGTVTTYLVIMIQMQNIYEPATKNITYI